MAKKSEFLKKVLTTAASATMVLAGGANSVEAALSTTTAPAYDLTAALAGGGAGNIAASFVNNNGLVLGGSHNGTTGGGAVTSISGINVQGNNGTLKIEVDVAIGRIFSLTNPTLTVGGLKLEVAAAKTVTLNNTLDAGFVGVIPDRDFRGLNEVSFTAADAKLTTNVGGAADVRAAMAGTAADFGDLKVSNTDTLTFMGGLKNLRAINIEGVGIFNNAVSSRAIAIAANKSATFSGATTVGAGNLIFGAAGTATFNANLGGTGIVDLNTGGIIVAQNNANISVDIHDSAANLGTVRVSGTGATLASVGAGGNSIALMDFNTAAGGASTVTGVLKATATHVTGNGKNTVNDKLTTDAITFQAGGGGNGTGTLIVNKDTSNIAGGAKSDVAFNADGYFVLGGNTVNAGVRNIDSNADGTGTFEFAATAAGEVAGTIGNVHKLKLVKVTGDGVFTLKGAVKTQALRIVHPAADVTADAAVKVDTGSGQGIVYEGNGVLTLKAASEGAVDFNGHNGTLILAHNVEFKGDVKSTGSGSSIGGGAGKVVLDQGNAKITGAIGASDARLKQLVIGQSGGVATDLTAAGVIYADEVVVINGASNPILKGIHGNLDIQSGTVTLDNATGTGGIGDIVGTTKIAGGMLGGTLKVAGGTLGAITGGGDLEVKAGKFLGTVGDNTTSLDEIRVQGVATFNEDVFATKTILGYGGAAATVTLKKKLTGKVNYAIDASSLTLDGKNAHIKGNVDFANHAGSIVIKNGATVEGEIDDTTAVTLGTKINVDGGGKITGEVGKNNEIGELNISNTSGNTSNFDLEAKAKVSGIKFLGGNIALVAGGDLTATGNIDFNGQKGAVIQIADGKTLKAANIDGGAVAGAAAGTIIALGGGKLDAKVGATSLIESIQLANNTGASVEFAFADDVKARKVQFFNGTHGVDLKIAAGKTLTADVEFAKSMAGNKITLVDNVNTKIDGSIKGTGVEEIIIERGGEITKDITEIQTLKVGTVAGGGTATLSGSKLGIGTVVFGNNTEIKVTNASVFFGSVDFNDKAGKMTFSKDGVNVSATFSSTGGLAPQGTVIFKDNATFEGNVQNIETIKHEGVVGKQLTLKGTMNFKHVEVGDGKIMLAGKITAEDFKLKNSADSSFELIGDSEITGTLEAVGANNGKLYVNGNGGTIKWNGDIGLNNPDQVIFSSNTVFVVKNDNAAAFFSANNGVDFKNTTSTLMIMGNQDWTFNAKITNATKSTLFLDGIGADKTVISYQDIGSTAAHLGRLKIGAGVSSATGKHIDIQNNVYVDNLEALGATNLKFTVDGKEFYVGATQINDNAVSLQINGNTTFKEGTRIGSKGGPRLKNLDFTADKTLTLENNVEIYANALVGDGVGRGTIEAKGKATLAANTTTKTIKEIKGIGTSSTDVLHLSGKFNVGTLTAGAGTITLDDDLTVTTGLNGGTGTSALMFVNPAAMTVTGPVGVGGGANAFSAMNFKGNNVTFAGQVTWAATTTLTIDGNSPIEINLNNATDLAGVAVVDNNSSNTGGSTLVVNNNAVTVNKTIGVAGKPVTVRADANTAFDVQVKTEGTIFATKADGQGEVKFTTANSGSGSIGSSTAAFKIVKAGQNAQISGNVYSKEIEVSAGKALTITGVVSSANGVKLTDNASTINFKAEKIDSKVVSVAGGGIANFEGSTIVQDVGADAQMLTQTTFTGAIASGANVYSANIDASKAQVEITNNQTWKGASRVTNVNLGTNQLTFTNAAAGDRTIVGEENMSVNVVVSGASTGSISGGSMKSTIGKIDLAAVKTININVDDKELGLIASGSTRSFTLLESKVPYTAPAVGANNVKLNIEDKSTFGKFTASLDGNGQIIITQENNSEEVLDKLFSAADDKATALEIARKDDRLTDEWNRMTPENIEKSVGHLSANTPGATTDLPEKVTSSVGKALGARVSSITAPVAVAPAAGDDESLRYGAWLTPLYSVGTQKSKNRAAGYRDTTYGGVLGFDAKIADSTIIGAAFSMLNTTLKYKGLKSGDKTRADSMLFSIYGIQEFTEQLFAQAVASFGSTRVKTKERRLNSNTTFQTAVGKYDAVSFSTEALLGYQYVMDSVAITPMAGVRYVRVNNDKYTESGTTNQNLTINRKADSRLDLIFGGKVSSGGLSAGDLLVTLEAHVFGNFDVIGKAPKVSMRLARSQAIVTPKSPKPDKFSLNAGVGASTSYSYMEYGVGYDYNWSQKYTNHQGSLKIRVNF